MKFDQNLPKAIRQADERNPSKNNKLKQMELNQFVEKAIKRSLD